MKWAGSRDKIFSPSGRGRTFLLTSLFIELIDPLGKKTLRTYARTLPDASQQVDTERLRMNPLQKCKRLKTLMDSG